MGKGARSRALGVLLGATVILGVLARRDSGSAAAPSSCFEGSLASVEVFGLRRAGCPQELQALVDEATSGCATRAHEVRSGALLVADGCRTDARRLPLGTALTLNAPVDLNALTRDELEGLPGIGPALARRIVEERRRTGGFSGVESLARVPGIGPAKYAVLRSILRGVSR